MTPKDLSDFAAFWPYYLAEHQLPACRALHYLGTAAASAGLILLVAGGYWAWLWLVLLLGYGPAWIAHFFIEHNRPATFTYPLWSLAADYRMFACWLSGRLPAELERCRAQLHAERARAGSGREA